MGRCDRAAAIEAFQPERRAALIARAGAKLAHDRQRNRRLHQVVGHELQQVGIAGGNGRIFPAFERRIAVCRPGELRIHAPRQAVHQSADILHVGRQFHGVDAEGAETLRGAWCAKQVTEAGGRALSRNGASPFNLGREGA